MTDDMDTLIPILRVAEVCGFPLCRRSPKRWALEGVRDRAGNVVRLGTVRVGGRLFSTRRHVAVFLAAIQPNGEVPQVLTQECGLTDDCGQEVETETDVILARVAG